MLDTVLHAALETWLVTARMAGWLLAGFMLAGLLSVFISPAWLERHLGGRGMGPVFKAALFGVPLPLCSCGVIPVAASLRAHGASRAATTGFLLSTPQTGVDSIFITFTMLGPLFAVFRPVAALVTGLLGGALVQVLDPHRGDEAEAALRPAGRVERPQGLLNKLKAAFDYGTVTLPGDIARALVVGVVIAGVLGAVIPEDFLARYLGGGPLSIALMMVVGIPIYVCATASVPLAASFIFLGASPGAALAFLIAGPATNAATVTTVSRVLGRRTALIYLLTVAVSAFGGGLLLDWLVPRAAAAVPQLAHGGHHHEMVAWIDHLWALLLVAVLVRSRIVAARRSASCGCEGGTCAAGKDAPMSLESEHLEIAVGGMNCSHCSGSVQRAVSGLEGVTACRVDLEGGKAFVDGEGLDRAAIADAIEALGFTADRGGDPA
ncbi:MAG TPA: permease [Candidatus Krumholzibacteria bacterium]|nr:permease [Candidatus Krumholzibacteria bacterium]